MIIGGDEFHARAVEKYDRRKDLSDSLANRRVQDSPYFDPPAKVIREFEEKERINVDCIDLRKYIGKRLRAKLLVHLRDRSGMKCKDIIKMPLFSEVKYNSLGSMYSNGRKRLKNGD